MPPFRWASATTCMARVDLPDDSGPKISMTRPRGRPPTPRAMSRGSAPVGMAAIFIDSFSPMRIIEPLPNCLSIWPRAMSRAFRRSLLVASATGSCLLDPCLLSLLAMVVVSYLWVLGGGTDTLKKGCRSHLLANSAVLWVDVYSGGVHRPPDPTHEQVFGQASSIAAIFARCSHTHDCRRHRGDGWRRQVPVNRSNVPLHV